MNKSFAIFLIIIFVGIIIGLGPCGDIYIKQNKILEKLEVIEQKLDYRLTAPRHLGR